MNPMRFNQSCPDCGFVADEHKIERDMFHGLGFNCERCGAHYARDDFMAELEQKHMAQYHNHAKADLESEQP